MALNVKRIIADTLYDLSLEKHLSKVTILDISERSGISRQTFYNHFKDKDDCIRWIFVRTLDRWDLVEKEGYYAYLCDLYRKARENSRFLRQACMLSGQNSLTKEIYVITYKYHKRHIIMQIGEDQLTARIEYALQFNAHGSTLCYIQWLTKNIPVAPEDMALYAFENMPQCIRQYFK
jgi:AcrR family transcriptional regulator